MTTTDTRFPILKARHPHWMPPTDCMGCGRQIDPGDRKFIVDPEGWRNRHCSRGCAELDQETLRRINA